MSGKFPFKFLKVFVYLKHSNRMVKCKCAYYHFESVPNNIRSYFDCADKISDKEVANDSNGMNVIYPFHHVLYTHICIL